MQTGACRGSMCISMICDAGHVALMAFAIVALITLNGALEPGVC